METKLNLSLLIVEDEPDLLDVLKENLSHLCAKVLTATNGLEALEVLKNNPDICAILSDISMPKMNGLELLAKVRSAFNPIPFIVLTVYGDSVSYREAIRLNATDFLAKPFKIEALEEVVKRALAYGAELLAAEKELEDFFKTAQLSPDKIDLLKRSKRTVMAMRIESSLYLKKKD